MFQARVGQSRSGQSSPVSPRSQYSDHTMSFFTDITERMEPAEAAWLPRGAPVPELAPAKLKKFLEGLESRGLLLFQVIFAKTPALPSEAPEDMVSWVRDALTGLKSPLPRQVSQETAENLTRSSVE